MKTNDMKISAIMVMGIIIIVCFVYSVNIQPVVTGGFVDFETSYSELKTFNSYSEFTDFLNVGTGNGYHWYGSGLKLGSESPMVRTNDLDADFSNFNLLTSVAEEGGELVDYSQTNVQVTGVDEPDIVKTDGEYLYIVSGNKVIIVKATPAEDAEIISEIEIEDSRTINNIFISGKRLVIFSQDYNCPIVFIEPIGIEPRIDSIVVSDDQVEEDLEGSEAASVIIKPLISWRSSPGTYILVYDLEDLENPEEVKNIVVSGRFSGARLIGDYVYLVTNQYSYELYNLDENYSIVPKLIVNGETQEIPLSDINYVDITEESRTLTNIVSININSDDEEVNAKIYLLGNSQVLYVSKDNIYVTYYSSNYNYEVLEEAIEEVINPLLPDIYKSEIEQIKQFSTLSGYQKKSVTEWILYNFTNSLTNEERLELYRELISRFERTTIHRISINNGEIEYAAQGQVPGQISNQFSLSEWNGHLRVSSTLRGWMFSSIIISSMETQNNIYILDMDLDILGGVEGLAPGETIYATRFLIDKCYLVTYRQVDPFFVIDLSDPTNPTVLGELKIPGYSTYLHPYDSTHIIGIGMEDNDVKISFFDVSDVENPIELSKYIIEQDENSWRWGQSYALNEHRAFLFDKEKNLLVIPAGDYYKQSAYVFKITIEDGLELKGVVEHEEQTSNEDEDYSYRYDTGNSIKRSLYIDDVLYTISDSMIKMNSLADLSEINSVVLS